jgi:CTP synthase (UTP-ammonia lyase)
MSSAIRIGLIGDYAATVVAHRAIPVALTMAGRAHDIDVAYEWVGTEQIESTERLAGFHGLWCVPASPYRSMAGALIAIGFARQASRPFLGTCGGFQHAIVEYARNVLGWADAEHGETAPAAARAVIAPLLCSLVEENGIVRFVPTSRLAAIYGVEQVVEGYHCRYGLNPEFQSQLVAGPLRAAAHDESGDIRAVQLDGHPFFVATLFQPERAALKGQLPPLVSAFVRACAG